MKVFVTGASGFLGRVVVRAAASAGHAVTALVRPGSSAAALESIDGDVTIVRGDLRKAAEWPSVVRAAEAIIHLAAAPGGELAAQLASTVVGTEKLLAELDAGSVKRFVHVSSLSVYDFTSVGVGDVLDEATPLERNPGDRDAYTVTKVLQERLVREACEAGSIPLIVLRPGAIFGPGKEWDHGVATRIGPLSVVFSPRATFRFTYVDNCADAIVAALTAPLADGHAPTSTVNIVDDDLPTHAELFRMCRAAGAETGWYVPLPWPAVAAIGAVFDLLLRRRSGPRPRLPEIVDRRRQPARWKPLEYSNARATDVLGWRPTVPVDQAVVATIHEREP